MSSPGARQRRRRQQYQSPRTRRELATAIGAAVGIVAATALMIWLLRPGGLADRQPRSSWLVGLIIFALAVTSYVVLRPGSKLKISRRVGMGGAVGAIAVLALVAGIFWPGGIIRHTPTFPTLAPTPTTNPLTSTSAILGSSTTAPGGTTTPRATTPGATTAPGATTTPGATAAPGATATTKPAGTATTARTAPVSPSP